MLFMQVINMYNEDPNNTISNQHEVTPVNDF